MKSSLLSYGKPHLNTIGYLCILVDEDDCMEIEDASDNDDDDGGSNDEDDEVHGQINTEQAKANVKVKLLSLLQVNYWGEDLREVKLI